MRICGASKRAFSAPSARPWRPAAGQRRASVHPARAWPARRAARRWRRPVQAGCASRRQFPAVADVAQRAEQAGDMAAPWRVELSLPSICRPLTAFSSACRASRSRFQGDPAQPRRLKSARSVASKVAMAASTRSCNSRCAAAASVPPARLPPPCRPGAAAVQADHLHGSSRAGLPVGRRSRARANAGVFGAAPGHHRGRPEAQAAAAQRHEHADRAAAHGGGRYGSRAARVVGNRQTWRPNASGLASALYRRRSLDFTPLPLLDGIASGLCDLCTTFRHARRLPATA